MDSLISKFKHVWFIISLDSYEEPWKIIPNGDNQELSFPQILSPPYDDNGK